jgi:hypothetical protein
MIARRLAFLVAVSRFNIDGRAAIVDLTGSNDSGTTGTRRAILFIYLRALR